MFKIQSPEKYTILIVSDGMKTPRTFKVAYKHIGITGILTFMVILSIGIIIGNIAYEQKKAINYYDQLLEEKRVEMDRLEAHNIHLRDELSDVEETLENIVVQQKIEEIERKIEATTQMEQSYIEKNFEGMGGAEEELNEYVPTFKPCEGIITSPFGKRDDPLGKKRSQVHKGIDVANAKGTSIYAAATGVIEEARYMNGYGYAIYIDHGQGVQTRYGHNSQLLVKQGEEVKKGQLIAKMGSTGNSTGNHLHFEILEDGKQVNPEPLFVE